MQLSQATQLPTRSIILRKVYPDGTESPALRITAISEPNGLVQWLDSASVFNSSDRSEEVMLYDLSKAFGVYIFQGQTDLILDLLKLEASVAGDACTVKLYVRNSVVGQQPTQAPPAGDGSSGASGHSDQKQKQGRVHHAWHKDAITAIQENIPRDTTDGRLLQLTDKGGRIDGNAYPGICS